MKTLLKLLLLTGLALITLCAVAQKQKNIVIDPSLEANSEALKIKLGTQVMGKMAKYQFGEYAVVEGRAGRTKTSERSNLLDTRQEVKAKSNFSFVMADNADNRATIHAFVDQEIRETREQKLIAFFYTGEDELLLNKHNFSATIFLNKDTANLWLLFMNRETGSRSENTGRAFLTNGERKILILSASSDKNGTDSRKIPARGYELVENDRALSALQYYGGGVLGLNKGLVWIDKQLEPPQKLVLSSAMTALLHLHYNELSEMDSPDFYDDW
ncbi:hypothetical protein OU798_10190 [Prolixibacteraceae bacterium Z1-6]|uniref:Uncharacterized protein n=1 Tax=Draconibacterium aestuarii TaxID=2998507 RepID=A0A9X3F513_9BACT|nr:hypothetical protein [Prolixibacteraceae bacterium Z1-6]